MPRLDTTPAEAARLKAGLSLPALARRLGLRSRTSPRYLRQLERNGGAPLHLAEKWACHVGADANLILHSPSYLRELQAVHAEQEQQQAPPRARQRRDPFLSKF